MRTLIKKKRFRVFGALLLFLASFVYGISDGEEARQNLLLIALSFWLLASIFSWRAQRMSAKASILATRTPPAKAE
jgi:multisubunit Na+/H+ antiporter MnhG subunit